MAKAQLLALRAILDKVAPTLDPGDSVECKHFFSGAAAYANGCIFMTLTTVGLAVKLPKDSRDRLIQRGAKPLRYFPQGPIKKDYVVVPRRLAEDGDALATLIKESIAFARTASKPRSRVQVFR
ncbi:MAG: TfoX/Sxy family protein [Proteobacteria bacterium]|nr:TfoX/Sxy family protein [Pseudomonadota bacterium]